MPGILQTKLGELVLLGGMDRECFGSGHRFLNCYQLSISKLCVSFVGALLVALLFFTTKQVPKRSQLPSEVGQRQEGCHDGAEAAEEEPALGKATWQTGKGNGAELVSRCFQCLRHFSIKTCLHVIYFLEDNLPGAGASR